MFLFALIVIAVIFVIIFEQSRKKKEISSETARLVSEYTNKYPDTYTFNVRGLHISSYQKRLSKCTITDEVTLEPEPDNKYDPNAIKVMTEAGLIGYVPREKTDYVGFLITKDHDAFIDEINNGEDDGYVSCTISILYNYKKNREK